jgi:hypothetical protein
MINEMRAMLAEANKENKGRCFRECGQEARRPPEEGCPQDDENANFKRQSRPEGESGKWCFKWLSLEEASGSGPKGLDRGAPYAAGWGERWRRRHVLPRSRWEAVQEPA